MMAKCDVASKLAGREERRKSSIVAGMVDAPSMMSKVEIVPEQTASVQEEGISSDAAAATVVRKPEKKTRRKQIVLQQSVHDKAEQKCKELDMSMNEVVNQLLQNWLKMD